MNQPAKILKENCYLYSLWSGMFVCYEGSIHETNRSFGLALFRNKVKRFICSEDPERIYNGVVWLESRDDNVARKLLIEDYESKIGALQEQIAAHKNRIHILKGEITNETDTCRDLT